MSEEEENYKSIFNELDLDKDGRIEVEELSVELSRFFF